MKEARQKKSTSYIFHLYTILENENYKDQNQINDFFGGKGIGKSKKEAN